MRESKTELCKILNCGKWDIEELLKSNIDIGKYVNKCISEYGAVNFNDIYYYAWLDEIDKLAFLDNYDEDDFSIYANYLDTHIYVKEGKKDYYWNNAENIMNEIEDTLGLEFETDVC